MWYFPNSKYKGVDYATPLYYQYYYINGNRKNSGKCTLLSSISGLYKYKGIYLDPTAYLKEMTARYWMAGVGVHTWPATMNTIKIQDEKDEQEKQDKQNEIRKIAKKNLSKQMPILVGAGKGDTPHMVLVVGYKNCGINLSDYLVLDSVLKKFTTLEDFFKRFPDPSPNWGEYLKGGYVYGEYDKYQD